MSTKYKHYENVESVLNTFDQNIAELAEANDVLSALGNMIIDNQAAEECWPVSATLSMLIHRISDIVDEMEDARLQGRELCDKADMVTVSTDEDGNA